MDSTHSTEGGSLQCLPFTLHLDYTVSLRFKLLVANHRLEPKNNQRDAKNGSRRLTQSAIRNSMYSNVLNGSI